MLTCRVILPCLCGMALATIARAQAAVEYAAKSSAAAAATSGMHLGVCPLDSMLIPCVRQFYPTAFYTAIVAICLALGVRLLPKSRA
jgi:hypothetical protein